PSTPAVQAVCPQSTGGTSRANGHGRVWFRCSSNPADYPLSLRSALQRRPLSVRCAPYRSKKRELREWSHWNRRLRYHETPISAWSEPIGTGGPAISGIRVRRSAPGNTSTKLKHANTL